MTGLLDRFKTKAGGSMILLALLLCIFRCASGVVLLFAAALLLWQKEPVRPWQKAGFVYLLAVVALIHLGRVSYPMMSQAFALYQSTPDLLIWIKAGNVHAPRLLVSYPGVLLSYVCSVPLDTGMSLFTALLFWFTYSNMGYAVEEVEGDLPGRSWLPVLLLFPMLVLTLIMNGRLVFAMCGYSLALVTVLRVKHMPDFRLSGLLPLAVAVLLCAVSTGTMLVCIVTSGLLLLSLCGKELSKKPLLLVCLAAALLLMLPYIGRMIAKLFAFFGPGLNGILGILQHGAGGVLLRLFASPAAWVLLAIGSGAILLGMTVVLWFLFSPRSRGSRYYALGAGIMISCACFPVGLSTGLMFIVPMMIFCCAVAGELFLRVPGRVTIP